MTASTLRGAWRLMLCGTLTTSFHHLSADERAMPESHPSHRPVPSRRRFSAAATTSSSPALRRTTSTKFQPRSLRASRHGRQRISTSSPHTEYTDLPDSSDHADQLSLSSGHSSHDKVIDNDDGLDTPLPPTLSKRASESNLEALTDFSNAFREANLLQEERIPLTYASLPPSPITSSPPEHRHEPTPLVHAESLLREEAQLFSLWDYLREELLATDFDSHQELKWERVSNFLAIPLAMEKVRTRGSLGHIQLLCARLMLARIYGQPDHIIWIYPMLRFLPLHVHDSTHSLRPCRVAPHP